MKHIRKTRNSYGLRTEGIDCPICGKGIDSSRFMEGLIENGQYTEKYGCGYCGSIFKIRYSSLNPDGVGAFSTDGDIVDSKGNRVSSQQMTDVYCPCCNMQMLIGNATYAKEDGTDRFDFGCPNCGSSFSARYRGDKRIDDGRTYVDRSGTARTRSSPSWHGVSGGDLSETVPDWPDMGPIILVDGGWEGFYRMGEGKVLRLSEDWESRQIRTTGTSGTVKAEMWSAEGDPWGFCNYDYIQTTTFSELRDCIESDVNDTIVSRLTDGRGAAHAMFMSAYVEGNKERIEFARRKL